MLTIHLKPKHHLRIKNGHYWAFAGEIAESIRNFKPGDPVALCSARGRLLGRGYINPHSLIAVRLLTRGEEPWDDGLFARRIESALKYRETACPGWESLRLIYSESDGIPGLIVDKYSDYLVLQSLTAGIEMRLDEIVRALTERLAPRGILLKSNSPFRALEGLDAKDRVLHGDFPEEITFHENKLVFKVSPVLGQKTGFFLDQRLNRMILQEYAAGKSVLDLYSYSGAWSMTALNAGASEAVLVDSSEPALQWARKNAEVNGFDNQCQFVKSDAQEFMKSALSDGRKFDIVVLDPPALIPSRSSVTKGSALYKSLNQQAIRILNPGGILVSCSCSHLMSRHSHLEITGEAAGKEARRLRLAASGGHSPDHPVIPGHPESEYLKCWFLHCE